MSAHTPGPWRRRTTGNVGNAVEAYCGKAGKYDDGWRTVAMFQNCEPTGLYEAERANAEANGNLIAAAPDLVAALEEILPHITARPIVGAEIVERARAALAKAKGKSI